MWQVKWVPCDIADEEKRAWRVKPGVVAVHCVEHREDGGVRYCKLVVVRNIDPPWTGATGVCA